MKYQYSVVAPKASSKFDICLNVHVQQYFTAETQDASKSLKVNPLQRITMKISHLFSSIFGHLTLIIDITLVAKHHLLNISWGMLYQKERIYLKTTSYEAKHIKMIVVEYLLDVPYPILDIIKGFLICDVIHEHDTLYRNKNTYQMTIWESKNYIL